MPKFPSCNWEYTAGEENQGNSNAVFQHQPNVTICNNVQDSKMLMYAYLLAIFKYFSMYFKRPFTIPTAKRSECSPKCGAQRSQAAFVRSTLLLLLYLGCSKFYLLGRESSVRTQTVLPLCFCTELKLGVPCCLPSVSKRQTLSSRKQMRTEPSSTWI